ncbi:ORF1044 [White spot syndrome virus]|uniref:ORF1044 n=1 Tax=White spot syndrome virus TaxID=342409 RepID=A0A2D3I6Q0_9VIRU|nr:ORF1044 [White spot syndrome virus]
MPRYTLLSIHWLFHSVNLCPLTTLITLLLMEATRPSELVCQGTFLGNITTSTTIGDLTCTLRWLKIF